VLKIKLTWRKGRKQREREDDIALLARQTIRVARTTRTTLNSPQKQGVKKLEHTN